jgi:hypothetical protein
MEISGPRAGSEPGDRFLECEEALDAEFQSLVRKAVKAGWGEEEVCVAITSLADHLILSSACNAETDALIRKIGM